MDAGSCAVPSQSGFVAFPTITGYSCVALPGCPLNTLNLQHPAANRRNVSDTQETSARPCQWAGGYTRQRAGVAPTSEAGASLAPLG